MKKPASHVSLIASFSFYFLRYVFRLSSQRRINFYHIPVSLSVILCFLFHCVTSSPSFQFSIPCFRPQLTDIQILTVFNSLYSCFVFFRSYPCPFSSSCTLFSVISPIQILAVFLSLFFHFLYFLQLSLCLFLTFCTIFSYLYFLLSFIIIYSYSSPIFVLFSVIYPFSSFFVFTYLSLFLMLSHYLIYPSPLPSFNFSLIHIRFLCIFSQFYIFFIIFVDFLYCCIITSIVSCIFVSLLRFCLLDSWPHHSWIFFL